MPRLNPTAPTVPNSSAGTSRCHSGVASPAEQPDASRFHVNPSRAEDILSLLAQHHRPQESVTASAVALPHSLGPPHNMLLNPFQQSLTASRTLGTFSPSIDSYLSISPYQLPSLDGLSPATVLDLARQRPDLLASLQQQRQSPTLQFLHGTTGEPTSIAQRPPRKRHRSDQETEHDILHNEKGVNERDASGQVLHARPGKRVMLLASQKGSPVGDELLETEEEENAWTADMHRSFVEAVFATGISHASPSVLLELMSNVRDFPLTSERVKSHLQKYRKNSEKSQADFIQEYETFLQRALSIGSQAGGSPTELLPTASVIQIMGQEAPLYGGDAAAAASYDVLCRGSRQGAALSEDPLDEHAEFDKAVRHLLTPSFLKQSSDTLVGRCQGQSLEIPQLSPEERASPLGVSLSHILSTFKALTSELDRRRSVVERGAMLDIATEASSSKAPISVQEAAPLTKKNSALANTAQKVAVSSGASGSKTGAVPTRNRFERKAPLTEGLGRETKNIGALIDLMYQRRKEKEGASKDMQEG